MTSRALLSQVVFAALLAACGSSQASAGAGLACYDVERGIPSLAPIGNAKKLDPDLRTLFALHRAQAVRVTVEFRGELGDLEAVGFVKHSLVAHPTEGYQIATGTIPIAALDALATIDHVVKISAPVAMH